MYSVRKFAKNIVAFIFFTCEKKDKKRIFEHSAHVCVNLRKRVRETSKKRRLFFVQKEESMLQMQNFLALIDRLFYTL